jgi:endonuclease YncB( thermonuclease family)
MLCLLRSLPLAAMLALLGFVASTPAGAAADDIIGPAVVYVDGSLRVGRNWIRLYGVWIPATGQQCRTFLSPKYCGNRAAVALHTRIQGFVFCRPVSRNRDGSVNAFCSVERKFYSDGVDLGAYLISRGLALAAPGSPFEYVALERIAQNRGLGVWGFQADSIIRR